MPPGQRLRVVLLEAGQADHLDGRLGQALPLGLVHAPQLGQQLDVLAHRAPRQQRGVLEHVAEVVAVDRDRAAGRPAAGRRRCAAASTCRSPTGRRWSRTPPGRPRTTRRRWPACRRRTSSRCARTPCRWRRWWCPTASAVACGLLPIPMSWPDCGTRDPARTGRPRVTAAAGVPGIASFHCASADLARPPRARGHRRSPPGHGGGGRGRAAHLVDGQRPRRAARRRCRRSSRWPSGRTSTTPWATRSPCSSWRTASRSPCRRCRSRSSTPSSPSRTASSTSTTASTSAASCGRRCPTSPRTRPSRARRRSPCRWSRTTSWPGWSATAATSCCRSTTP